MIRSLLPPLALAFALVMPSMARADDRLEHAVYEAEDHRRGGDAVLALAAQHGSSRLRARAALAIGRIGAPEGVNLLTPLLADVSGKVRVNAAFALGILGGDAALTALKGRLPLETSARVMKELILGIGRLGKEADLPLLYAALNAPTTAIRAPAAQAIGHLFLNNVDLQLAPVATLDRLLQIARFSTPDAVSAAFALARQRGQLPEEQRTLLVRAYRAAKNPEARALLARPLGKNFASTSPQLLKVLLAALDGEGVQSLGVKTETLRALGNYKAPAAREALVASILDPANEPQAVVQALEALGKIATDAAPAADAVVSVIADTQRSTWIRGAALESLPAIAPDRAAPVALRLLTSEPELTASALTALGSVETPAAFAAILPFLHDRKLKIASAAVLALTGFDDALLTEHAKSDLLAALGRHDLAMSSTVAEIAARAGWRDFAAPLAAAYAAMVRPDDLEGKVALLDALGKIGDAAQLPLIEAALSDDARAVALAAAAAYEALTGTNVMDRVPEASNVRGMTAPLAALRAASTAKVQIETTRGTFVLQMLDLAPLTAHNFVTLVRSSYYDGLTFHRVVPNFVVQGGDPRGDGYGGPGYLIREELSPLNHQRGFVGMATAGKDTGGSQWFVNHAPNLHLDGAYTVFAKVDSGLEVIDRLEMGDTILKAQILD